MSSKHSRAHTLPPDLFHGVSDFRTLEARISSLPEELTRGDAFEVFVEAFWATTPVWQVADLWLVGQVPLDVRRNVNLPSDAKGIDGVFRTRSGALVPYQVKFRDGRPKVGVTEVATFLGLTERAADRVLISNTDHYAADVEARDRLRLLRGSDFDSLTADDWTAIADWIDARPVIRSRATPRADQQLALGCIAEALTSHDRATVVMPCGTGKTLVGLWAAEQQEPKSVLVLVPSLALLSQTLDEWGRHTSWGDRFEYLCVCSDPSVSAERDALQIRATDVPFHVDTDPDVVLRFLDRPSTGTTRVVFSTYQSSPVVAEGMRGLQPFDVGIFDEAHKTTGPRHGVFALALDDARLAIRKRLFFTATPRHIDIRHRDREGDFPIVSMDDAAVYGPPAYVQTFADAVERGIICDYRVVVSVVDQEEISPFALQHGITLVAGDQQATRWVATLLSVSKAISETGARKVITFHSRVSVARSFAGGPPRGIQEHLDGFVVDHVNGDMRVADRKAILYGFRGPQARLVTNARCLTEGVDLPAVDMVVFSDPRKSRVDIVQAVGRAMRRPKEGAKELGFVVVPILLAPHDACDLVEACADTDWEDLIGVLAALREHDARLDALIRDQQVAKGAGRAYAPRAFREHVQVTGPLVSLEVLQHHIDAVLLSSLGVRWDQRYGELVAFKAREGHCNVPALYPENPRLGQWVRVQRRVQALGRLSDERRALLEDLGFVWNPLDAAWEERFVELSQFHREHGHSNVPYSYPLNPRLGWWLTTQRRYTNKGRLSRERVERLSALGVVWNVTDAAWQQRYEELVAYHRAHGHSYVPLHTGHAQLSDWLRSQKSLHAAGKLVAERVARLTQLGVQWQDFRETLWEKRFRELKAFREHQGHCNVPSTCDLGSWLSVQRQFRRQGRLSDERIGRLTELGVQWALRRSPQRAGGWDGRYDMLVAFQARHGHCDVPADSEDGLGRWLVAQRVAHTKGQLAPDRRERLEQLGVVWDTKEERRWRQRFDELVEYKRTHGHCRVPPDRASPFSTWVVYQRQSRRRGDLSEERIALLDSVGYEWSPHQLRWDQQCDELEAFRNDHGHCNVPLSHPSGLGAWLTHQRVQYRKGALAPKRVARLNELCVSWDAEADRWNQRVEELIEFKRQHGHCWVPVAYPPSPALGTWLANLRPAKKRGQLAPERIQLLETLGVKWEK